DQLARLLDGLRRRVAVVIGDEVDLAAVDAAARIDLVEIGLLGLADHTIGGGRTTIGHDVTDLYFGVGGTGVVFLLCECGCRSGCEQGKRSCSHGQASAGNGHCVFSLMSFVDDVCRGLLERKALFVWTNATIPMEPAQQKAPAAKPQGLLL